MRCKLLDLFVVQVNATAVAVVADTWWQAKKAVEALPVTYEDSPNTKVSSASIAEHLKEAQGFAPRQAHRQAYFDGRLHDTPVVARAALARRMQGPLIVEELDATCVIPPGASAELDGHGNIVIDAGP